MTAYSPLRQANELLNEPVLKDIAKSHGKTVAQVALKWNVQRGVVVIQKTVHKNRMIENLDIFGFTLTPEEMNKINSMKPRDKVVAIHAVLGHPDSNNLEE